jgi:hypothetical protein
MFLLPDLQAGTSGLVPPHRLEVVIPLATGVAH